MRCLLVVSVALLFAACTPPAQQSTEAPDATSAALDPAIVSVVEAAMPGIVISGGESDGEGEFEVTGVLDGQDYEFDLMGPDGGWRVVEIQRDIAWVDAPEAVRAAVGVAQNSFEPARVIESRQPVDGSVVYELFTEGATTPAMEVRFLDGEAAVMPPAH
jgi:hypothetical protein